MYLLGIYIAADRNDVPSEYRGIGIRIEDDVLLTATDSVQVLSNDCVKDIASIEELLKNNM